VIDDDVFPLDMDEWLADEPTVPDRPRPTDLPEPVDAA
jgi:hypothetical protein